jgi:hypothetical protein
MIKLNPTKNLMAHSRAGNFMSASLPEKDAPPTYVIHEMEVSFWRFDWPAFLRALGNRDHKRPWLPHEGSNRNSVRALVLFISA